MPRSTWHSGQVKEAERAAYSSLLTVSQIPAAVRAVFNHYGVMLLYVADSDSGVRTRSLGHRYQGSGTSYFRMRFEGATTNSPTSLADVLVA